MRDNLLISSFLVCLACNSDKPKTNFVSIRSHVPLTSNTVEAPKEEEFTVDMAKKNIAIASGAFKQSMEDKDWTKRIATFRSFGEAIDKASTVMDMSMYRSHQFIDVRAALQSYDEIYTSYNNDVAPEEPIKPTYSEPEYHGAIYLTGSFRKWITLRAMLVQSWNYTCNGSDYFVIEDGKVDALFNCPNCYVENTGQTIWVDVGRNGRNACLKKVSDRETYEEDRADYERQLSNAKSQYYDDLKAYQKSMVEYNQHQASHKSLKNKLDMSASTLNMKFSELNKVLQ